MPKSRKARRRLVVVAAAGVVLAASVALTLNALKDSVQLFYSPFQARAAHVPAGRPIELGGLVATGSLQTRPDGSIAFAIVDHPASDPVAYKGDVPDLFREGQGVVAKGAFRTDGVFEATEILAKHDERYMPREVVDALKKSGEWRGGEAGVATTGGGGG
jgi:cytochrome c-type biogenesis protein CcmE